MEDRPNFKLAENMATSVLLAQEPFDSLKIDVTKLHYDYDIIFDSMQNYCLATNRSWDSMNFDKVKNGHTIILDDNLYLVLYNADHSPERINWTLGHEVGHVYCGHETDGKKEEIETSFFAAQLLMPEAAIRKLAGEFGFLDFGWIYANFNVSLQAAVKRVNTLNSKYYKKDKTSSMIIDQFNEPLRELVIYFLRNSSEFNADLKNAQCLLDSCQSEHGDGYVLKAACQNKRENFLPNKQNVYSF